jgi:hypothetical protein
MPSAMFHKGLYYLGTTSQSWILVFNLGKDRKNCDSLREGTKQHGERCPEKVKTSTSFCHTIFEPKKLALFRGLRINVEQEITARTRTI